MRFPHIDSAVGRGLLTILEALFVFFVGLIIAVAKVPGVPEAVASYTSGHIGDVFITLGIPTTLSMGITSFLINYFFRGTVKTY